MPHPEHAVDPLTGSADGLRLFGRPPGSPACMSAHIASSGLTDSEYDLIVEKMGREPNEVELAVFSLMWSEHCGYKHSRRLLKTLPTEGPRLVLGPGENAGAVVVGDGLACAFKVESHNHPSAVEPFEGAATGVGGILRDIFAIGARPIAILDSLRFGEVATSARSRYLLERAVAGIGHYGNSIGIATVGGEIYFEGPYEQNCLVNAMALGLIETDKLIRSAAAGVGNIVVLFGARTGRDGIGGASVLASAELDDSEDKRPTVQIGDPFTRRSCSSARWSCSTAGCWSRCRTSAPPGLTSSSAEMAAKGEVGLDLDVRLVPLREADMEPFEIMVSESQERMLCVVEPERLQEVLAVCARWEVNGTAIGEVTDTRRLRVFDGDELVGDMPVTRAGGRVPGLRPRARRARDAAVPGAARGARASDDPGEILVALLGLLQRRLAQVGVRAVRLDRRLAHRAPARAGRRGGADAAVGRRRPADRALPGRRRRRPARDRGRDRRQRPPRRRRSLPRRGRGRRSSARANLACVGAEPLGLTNCLNFGNPEKPHIAWQLTRADRGSRRRLPRVRHPGRRRQRVALQRGRRGPDLPDAGRRPGRRAAGRARARGGSGSSRRATRSRWSRPAGRRRRRRRSCPSCAARRSPGRCRASTSARSRRCTPRSARRSAPARCTPPTTSPRAASRSRSPSRASPPGSAPPCPASASEASCSARARARSSSPGRPMRWPRSAPPRG